ncbi:glycosyltransferase family 1 protein [Backusella circina FSU 941]|nr:glycosyltransferase family 1 protein [Backusella circina FSU 941]
MKFLRSIVNRAGFILLCLSTFCCAVHENSILSLTESYNEPRNIGFSALFGGSSHYNWVLVILNELKNRGHNVSFIAKNDGIRCAKLFPEINTISLGPDLEFEDKNLVFTALEERTSDIKMKLEIGTAIKNSWSKDYPALLDFIKSYNIDLMLCDHFSEACVDASRKIGIPFIVTSVLEMTQESDAPYVNVLGMTVDDFSTEHQSIYKRFKDYFIEPFEIISAFQGLFNDIVALKRSFGVDTSLNPSEAWGDSIKLVNSFFGLAAPRPLGALVEQVGPIIPRYHPTLTEDLRYYLNSHRKTVYVSFGQHATPSRNTIRLLLTSLLENLESGDIDGIIWAVVNSQKYFPDYVTTSSNTTYSIRDLLDGKHPSIRFDKWIPQIALLLHPSTHIFVSHGGYGSCIESMYAGVRMVVVPSFADQFGNAMSIQRANLGVSMRLPVSLKKLTNEIKRVASDEDGEIKKSLKRMQAIVQIRSRNGPKIGADVVEEVLFSHANGKIPHRYAASRRLSFIRAHNIDLYFILATIVSSIIIFTGYAVISFKGYIVSKYGQEKKKKTM